jgi:hypothetical protein
VLALVLVLASCGDDASDDSTPEAVVGVADPDLKVVLQEQYEIDKAWEEYYKVENPDPDVAAALNMRQIANLELARTIDPVPLSAEDRLTLEVFLERYGSLVAVMPCWEEAGQLASPRRRSLDAPPAAADRALFLDGSDHPATTPACYQAYVRYHTTTDLTPEAIHQIGLDELVGIEAEINELGARMYGTTTLADLRARLDADLAERFASVDEIMTTAQGLVDEAVETTTPLFASMPTSPLKLVIGGGQAFYNGPWDDHPFGEYSVATEPVEAQRRYQLPSVTFHEGIPGHHLERSRAYERRDLPWMRRTGGDTIYVEGWGFYTEYLAEDIGLFADDVERLGALSNRALRASRLVVDTGLHAMGWDLDQAEAFLTEHTLEPPEYVEIQARRYFNNPGQALAYMLGAREILRLRDKAEATLGDRFSLRAFHEAFLSQGSLPLAQMTAHMEAWIAEQAAAHD